MSRLSKRRAKRISNQLELDFSVGKGIVHKGATQMEFDFVNVENNFFCQRYKNKESLKVDLLRLMLVDKWNISRDPVRRVLLFKDENTRKRVTKEHQTVLRKYHIETVTGDFEVHLAA
jgi:hypothetical protein